jgi:hypothetical protein
MTRLRIADTAWPPIAERSDLVFRPIEEVLERYNFTLEEVVPGWFRRHREASRTRTDALLRRKRWIRSALGTLQNSESRPRETGDQHPHHPELKVLITPTVLAAVGSLPTLLYRFVRRGDANDWSRLVLPRQGPNNSNKKRGRPTAGPAV